MESDTQEKTDPMLEETRMLEFFRANFTTNPKKLKKLARTKLLDPSVKQFIKQGFLQDLYNSKDPVKYLKDVLQEITEYPIVIRQLIEEGNHGMIVTSERIYPVKLETLPKWLTEGDPWCPEQENMVQIDAANNWMRAYDVDYIDAKVVLFQPFGFSGVPRRIRLKCTKQVSHLNRIAGTNYYVP